MNKQTLSTIALVLSLVLNALGGLGIIDPVAGPCKEASK